jgi:general secretion pathway protein N
VRLDDAPPRTWLLAAVAAWAVLAWVLALAGMGTRIAALPEDPALLRPLPPLRPPAPDRLGPPTQYGEIASRPLFSTDRRPKPFSLQGGADGEGKNAEFDYRLTSVLITPSLKMAILQPPDGSKSVRVRMGEAPETHPAWRLETLNARSAVFVGPEGPRTLELRVFDGQGGQPPTPGTPTPAARSAGSGRNGTGADGSPPLPIDPPPRSNGAAPASPAPEPTARDADAPASAPASDQAQMEAIRQRIQARREQLRQQQSRTKPPVQ